MSRRLAAFVVSALLTGGGAEAKITKIEILSTELAFGGARFGDVGAYDRLLGRAEGNEQTGRCPGVELRPAAGPESQRAARGPVNASASPRRR